jgi:hypothetical protein
MMFVTSIIDDPNPRGRCASFETGSIDMIETPVMRELAVRELDPNLGNLGGSDGTRLDRLRTIAADLEKIKMMTFDQIEELRRLKQPQPTYDFEISKISAWCRKHGYTCHVTLRGELELRKKQPSGKRSGPCF